MARTYEQLCPVAVSLDVLGDRWTLPLLRDLLWHGPHRFNELIEANPGLSPALLSKRLVRLVDEGLVERLEAGAAGASYYRLSSLGRRIEPVIAALYEFGAPLLTEVSVSNAMVAYVLRRAAIDNADRLWDIADTAAVSLVVDDAETGLVIGPGALRVVDEPNPNPTLGLRMTSAAFIDLVAGRGSLTAAIEAGAVQVEGDRDLAEKIAAVL